MAGKFTSGYAVVIGVGADLPVTVGDANGVAAMLKDPSRCAYPPEQVRLLTGEDAGRGQIIQALEWLASAVGPSDTAIVYFSGHGTEQPEFYLVPFGFDWEDLGNTAIKGTEFTGLLQAIKAQKLLVLLDCCHAGGQAEAKGKRAPLSAEVLNELGNGNGRVVIASSRKNEVSWTGDPYSQFTQALLEAIAGRGAAEMDGYARVLDIAMWVGRKVPERTGDKQHPIIKVSNLNDNFAVSWYAAGQATLKELPWRPVDAPTPVQDYLSDVTRRRILGNYQETLLLIEERMSQFVDFTDIPLQLVKNRQQIERQIRQFETSNKPI